MKVPKIAYAFDQSTYHESDARFFKEVRPHIGVLKAGLEAATAPYQESSTVAYAAAEEFGFAKTVLDIKLHDIPNTIEGAVRNLSGRYHGITLHASSGPSGLKAAASARALKMSPMITTLFAVTVLTSHDETECVHIFGEKPGKKVLQFARDCVEAGIDGLVCSGLELSLLQEHGLTEKLITFVPGGRPPEEVTGDQKRVVSLEHLVKYGADYAVLGRPIRKSSLGHSPVDAARRINDLFANAAAKFG